MVEVDVCKLMAVIAAAYPRFEVDEFKKQVWFDMLGDLPYELAQMAAKKIILESPYPPTVADIRQQAVTITEMAAGKKDGATAWGEVVNAIRAFGSYREEEAIDTLSDMTRKVVRMLGWREICLSQEPGVIRGQFLKMYSQVEHDARQQALLPREFKEKVLELSDGLSFESGQFCRITG